MLHLRPVGQRRCLRVAFCMSLGIVPGGPCAAGDSESASASEAEVSANVTTGLKLRLDSRCPGAQGAPASTLCLTLRNNDTRYWAILPYFLPEGASFLGPPHSILRFEIRDPAGNLMDYTGQWTDSKIAEPTPEDLLALSQDHFYGRSVDLVEGPFAYALEGGVRYSVQGHLSLRAGTWLAQLAALDVRNNKGVRFALDRVAQVEISSNVVTLEISER